MLLCERDIVDETVVEALDDPDVLPVVEPVPETVELALSLAVDDTVDNIVVDTELEAESEAVLDTVVETELDIDVDADMLCVSEAVSLCVLVTEDTTLLLPDSLMLVVADSVRVDHLVLDPELVGDEVTDGDTVVETVDEPLELFDLETEVDAVDVPVELCVVEWVVISQPKNKPWSAALTRSFNVTAALWQSVASVRAPSKYNTDPSKSQE